MIKTICNALLLALLVLGHFVVSAQPVGFNFAGVDVPPPLAAQNVQDAYWGVKVDDPYRFLEQVKEPAVVTWMKAQAMATETILQRLPGRPSI